MTAGKTEPDVVTPSVPGDVSCDREQDINCRGELSDIMTGIETKGQFSQNLKSSCVLKFTNYLDKQFYFICSGSLVDIRVFKKLNPLLAGLQALRNQPRQTFICFLFYLISLYMALFSLREVVFIFSPQPCICCCCYCCVLLLLFLPPILLF